MRPHRPALSALVLALAAASPLLAQAPTPEQQLAQAMAVLGATETERGAELLRELLATLPPPASPQVRLQAEVQLAAASWSLGLFDSAAAHFQEAIRRDPFVELDREIFNPDLVSVFGVAKRATIAVGVRAARDTALDPKTDRWPVRIAVTQAGRVQLHLAGPGGEPAGRDSVIATLAMDSTSTLAVSLTGGDGLPLPPGSYRLFAEYSGSWRLAVQATLRLEVSRQAADTAAHQPVPPDSLLRPEYRLGPPSRASLLRGLGFGVLAGAIPLLGSNGLGERSLHARAALVGAAVSVAGVVGAFTARPKHPVPENVAYNRTLRAAWQERDRAIASANEARRLVTLLRVRVVSER